MNIEKQWYVLRLKPLTEFRVHNAIAETGAEVYLPLIEKTRVCNKKSSLVTRPLITGYIFVYCSCAELERYRYFRGVLAPLCFAKKYMYLTDSEINILKIASQNRSVEITAKPLCTGQKVNIVSGPFAGYSGEVYKLGHNAAVYVHVGLPGIWLKLKVPRNMLSSISP